MRNTRACFMHKGMHTRVKHVCVLARARVENLIQSAAKRGLILCAYPYGGVRAENTRFYAIREDKRAARMYKNACTRK